ncbi:MAG: hypothetical protein HGB26_01700 [Desulfobulbaceae bacterium]|nr:hypothetical protein [Desulfobulbaceae bacterium]
MPVLTGIDVLGVQRFVFASNRLRDVVTGSFLVHWSTSRQGALSGLVAEKNILLAGGGNAIVEFHTIDEAKVFAAQYTRRLYDEVPSLEVVLVHEIFENGKLAVSLQNLQNKLAKAKTERLPSVPLSGLSVTATCMETGLPATDFDSDETIAPISRNICKRRNKRKEANEYWYPFLQGKESFDFPLELDKLGRDKGDTSLIGIVHVDGNGVGAKIKEWLEKVDNAANDDTVRCEYKEWSQAIDQLGQKAFQVVVDRIFKSVEISSAGQKDKVSGGTPARLGFTLTEASDHGRWLLPIRPILLGGDDLTFVCDGRIALDLAETALGVFEHSDISHLGNITASAGIAIVRVHSPFARGYELAEKLCRSAKVKLKKENDAGCALDWHIGIARPGEPMADIRKRQYLENSFELTCRPYRLGIGEGDIKETWRWLSRMLLGDKNCGLRGDVWSERRNKVKALGELVREGPDGVRSALKAWRVVDNKLQLPSPIENNGFIAVRTPLRDAVEILDLHLVLGDVAMTKTVEEKLP